MAEVLREAPRVALLGRNDAVRTQLRSALAELGALLVYEGELRGADPSAVSAALPAVVLLNLDAEGEDALDGLDELLLDPSMRVVFNEAETTAALSGWDLARWARHLAAKVLGHDRTIPPPPAGAEYEPATELHPIPGAPPTPESLAPTLTMEILASEAVASVDRVPPSSAPVAASASAHGQGVDDSSLDESSIDIDTDLVASAMSASVVPAQLLRNSPAAEPADEVGLAEDGREHDHAAIRIDYDELDAALAAIDAGDAGDDGAFPMSTEAFDDSAALQRELEALADGDDSDYLDGASIGSDAMLDGEASNPSSRLQFSSDAEDLSDGSELDADVAALAAQLESLGDTAPKGEMAVRDPDFFFENDVSDAVPPKPSAERRPAPSGLDLSLTDELGELQAAAPRPAVAAPRFDISHLSLEALPDPGLLVATSKPKPPREEPYLPRPGIDLMLAPLDAHLNTKDAQPEKPSHAKVAADLGEAPDLGSFSLEPVKEVEREKLGHASIPRVLVLGASIGGPDALRTFLGGLPADFPALLVLAQHLESGFFDRLSQQLQKVSKLPVRVASSNAPACAGEVIIIPSGERVKIARDGRVTREVHQTPTHYRPCIDDVMRDIADAFGKRATAIIFSGMAGDAVEGAVYITAKGGEVWTQTPDSCVVSSMVDGAHARGVVEFVGSPRELAEHCVARYGDGS